jgi:AcrR family transcriptional regulator
MHPDDRRAQLLAAARRVFARQGYHATSVAHILAEAGVARGTFYNYFDSKRAVFGAVLEDITGELIGVVRPIELSASLQEQVRAAITHLVTALVQPDVARILFAAAVNVDAEGDAELRAFYDRAEARLAGALTTGQGFGLVRTGSTALMARCLIGMAKEPVFLAQLRDEPLDGAALIDQLFHLLTEGALHTPH